jgi:hypothetical protein
MTIFSSPLHTAPLLASSEITQSDISFKSGAKPQPEHFSLYLAQLKLKSREQKKEIREPAKQRRAKLNCEPKSN